MKKNAFQRLQDIKLWQLRLFLVIFSIVLTEIVVASMGLLLKGYIPFDYLLTGLVASSCMATLFAYILNQFREQFIESQLQLHAIIENEPECVKLMAADGSLLQMNRAGLAMIEADSPDQVIGHPVQQIILPKYRNAFITLTKKIFEGKSGNLEFEIRGIKGTYRWLDTHAVPLRDKHGSITALLSITRDITDHKQAQQTQQEALERLEKIANSVPGMVYQFRLNVDGSSYFPYASPAIQTIYRITPEEARDSAAKVFAILHPEDFEQVVTSMNASAQHLTPWQQEYRTRFEDGSEHWLLGNASPQREADGAILWHGFITDITEQKQATLEKRNSEEKLQAFYELDLVGLAITSPEKGWLSINKCLCDMLEYSEQELHLMTWAELTYPDDIAADVEQFERMLANEINGYTLEKRFVSRTGKIIFTTLVVRCIRKAAGDVDYVLAMVEDITERKQASQQLQKSEEQLQLVLEGGHLGFWDWNLLTNEVERNVIWADILGYTYEEIKNTTQQWGEFVYLDDRERAWQSIDNALKGDTPYHEAEYRMLHKDGSIRWILDHASVVQRDSKGQPTRMSGTHTDITQLKRMEQQLRDSENKLNIILDNVEAFIYIKDCNYQYQYANQRVRQLFGQPLDAIINKTDYEFFDSATAANVRENDRRVIEYGERLATEEVNVSNDDVIDNAYLSIKQPLRREDGSIYGLCGISTDITERKKMERQLRNNEAFTNSILDSLTSYISVLDSEGIILAVNNAWRQFAENNDFHETNYDVVGANYFLVCQKAINRLNHEDITAIQDGIMAVLSGIHDHFYLEYPCHAPTEKRWFCMNVSPLKGTRSGIVISHENITERKLAEIQLRIAATVFESHEGMFITDADKIILNVNQAFTRITGYSAAEAIGQTPKLLCSGRHDKTFYDEIWRSINDTGRWKGEIWNRRKNGQIYPEWLTITAARRSNNDKTITHYVATLSDITARKVTEDYIHQLAFYDLLTQLPNRQLLQERIKHAIDLNHRTGSQMALLMLDLDKFKAVNDNFGHALGDELLQQVAKRIKAHLREVDMVARLGGDEFVVLLEEIDHSEHVARVANDIILALSQPFKLCETNDVYIGVSIGIAIHPRHGDSVDILLDNADMALYHAKDEGRSCFAYFSEELTKKARERITLETRLRHAIDQQELHVYFQPQIDINSGQIVGAEALVRWHDPIRGCISPSEFIALAEDTGLIAPLGEFVLRETCRLGRQWLNEGLPAIMLAVNVSPYQFRRCDINALVSSVLQETDFPACFLELEITESGLMDNQQYAMDILNNLHNQGVHLAIDDFGTGYSSLAYLKYFPVDVLKIDKTFIDDIPLLQGDMAITAAIIAMAHHLGFKVLAEGVETAEQLAFLSEHSCDMYQGYFCSKPIAASDFAKLLSTGIKQL